MEILPNDWDGLQKSLGASILQSTVWSEFQQSLGRNIYFEFSNHWSWVGFEHSQKGFRYLFIPYGPTASLNTVEAMQSVVARATKEGFDFVRVEPMGKIGVDDLDGINGVEVQEVEPKHTQIINLQEDEQQLRRALNSGHRNLINGAERRGLTVRVSENNADFEVFLGMLHDTAKRSKVKFHDDDYFWMTKSVLGNKGFAKLYMVDSAEQPVAGALFYDYNGVRYYAHAGAYQELNRKLNGSVVLLWAAILDAKQAGMYKVDLWGVAPNDDSGHKWTGISKFKKGFGGHTVNHLGTFDIPINQSKYKAYRLLRKIRGRA